MHETGIQKQIKEVVERIVSGFAPEKVILFGSHARGEGGSDSDLDILVVMRIEGSRRQKATEIDCALFGIKKPNDLIVVTPEELERSRHSIGSIISPVLKEGIALYEKAA